MNIGEVLIGALTPALQSVATVKLNELFDKIHEKDAEGHAAALKSLYVGASQLARLTDKTKTKVDDAIVDALVEAIKLSAEKYEVVLPE